MGKGQREKGIVLSYVNMAVNFIIGIIFTPFMLRILSDSEYGLYSIASSVVAYLSLLDLGLGNSMIRFTAKYRAQGDKEGEERVNGMFFAMFAVLGVLSLIIGAVLCLNMDIFFKRTFTPDEIHRAKVIFLILLVNTCVSLVTTAFSAIVNSNERFVFNRTFNLVTNIIKYSAEAIVLASGFQSVGMTVTAVTVSIASKAVPMWYCFKVIKAKFRFDKFDKEVFKSIMNYSFFIFINIFVEQLYANTDKIILGSVIGTVAVAVYQVSANLQKDFSQFSASIGGVFLPMLTAILTCIENSVYCSVFYFLRICFIRKVVYLLLGGRKLRRRVLDNSGAHGSVDYSAVAEFRRYAFAGDEQAQDKVDSIPADFDIQCRGKYPSCNEMERIRRGNRYGYRNPSRSDTVHELLLL